MKLTRQSACWLGLVICLALVIGLLVPIISAGGATKPKYVSWKAGANKWVPIFSLERDGAYVGAAQVAGPKVQVAKVKGVAEVQMNFKRLARLRAYVPVSSISIKKLDRVQGVSVWATGDLKIVKF